MLFLIICLEIDGNFCIFTSLWVKEIQNRHESNRFWAQWCQESLRPPTIDNQVGYDGRRAYGSWVARYVLGSIEVAA